MTKRQRVELRANGRCEYCQASQAICGYTFHIEHLIPEVAGGKNVLANYALSCASCNLFKGAYTQGIDPDTGKKEWLFNPRTQIWTDHFEWSADFLDIKGKAAVGRATIEQLKMNLGLRREARGYWFATGEWP